MGLLGRASMASDAGNPRGDIAVHMFLKLALLLFLTYIELHGNLSIFRVLAETFGALAV